MCGTECVRNSARQRFCSDCAVKNNREQQNRLSIEYYKKTETPQIKKDVKKDVWKERKTMNNNLALIRRARGLTQKELAAALGVTQGFISKYENGTTNLENITVKNALALAKILDCRVEDLICEPK